jgi:hypothetical protein
MVNVGDKVSRSPVTFSPDRDELLLKKTASMDSFHEAWQITGTVVYVHPQGRYHIVEFDMPGGKVREAFMGT